MEAPEDMTVRVEGHSCERRLRYEVFRKLDDREVRQVFEADTIEELSQLMDLAAHHAK